MKGLGETIRFCGTGILPSFFHSHDFVDVIFSFSE